MAKFQYRGQPKLKTQPEMVFDYFERKKSHTHVISNTYTKVRAKKTL